MQVLLIGDDSPQDISRQYAMLVSPLHIDLSKGETYELIKWKGTLLLWAHRESLYTSWMKVLNVNYNIIKTDVWILCGY